LNIAENYVNIALGSCLLWSCL